MKKSFLIAFIASVFALPVAAEDVGGGVDISANVGLSTDYIWRGVSQTGGHPAVSGGFDVGHESGLYVGNWNSNVNLGDSSLEMDFYGGLSNSLFGSGVNYDVGAIGYVYPGEDDLNFYEIYAGLSTEIGAVAPAAKAYYDPDNQNYYVDSKLDISLPAAVTLTGHYGATIPDNGGYVNDYLVGVSRPFFGVDVGVMYTDSEADKGRVVGTISKSF